MPLPQRRPTGDDESKSLSNAGRITQPPSFVRPEPLPVQEVSFDEEFGAPSTPAPSVTPSFTMPVEPYVEDVPAKRVYEEPAVAQAPSPVEDPIEELADEEELEERKREALINGLSAKAKRSARLLLERIGDDKCSEVLMNGPQNIMVKENGNRLFMNDISFDSVEEYHTVINTLILHDTDTAERIGSDNYLIEGQLELPDYENEGEPPLFARVHVLTPPVVKAAKVTIAKKAKRQFKIEDFVAKGTMNQQMASFLKAISRGKATTVFSGLSGAGKTTLLEASSYEFDENDRVVVVEDTAELRLPVYDVVPLLATSRKPGQHSTEIVTLEWLVAQANRMRPDRIIVGESRGGEFAEFLTAANSGADGSMTTIHASSTKQAVDKMQSLAMKSSTTRSEMSVARDISSTVQIIVQMALIDGQHKITQIDELSDIINKENGVIAMQPLFAYDRNQNRFMAKGQPSEKLTQFLAGRGVTVDRAWFSRM
jgi:pilus assembly protein CpaF